MDVPPILVTLLAPPLMLLPAAAFVLAARHRLAAGGRRPEGDAASAISRPLLIMLTIPILTCPGMVLLLAVTAAGWALLWLIGMSAIGCAVAHSVGQD